MLSFAEAQFPTDISYGATGGPTFLTDVVATVSGHEQRNSKWSQSRARYNVATGIKTEAQWHALIAFFRARRGKAVGFRFKDWSDFKAEAAQIGIGDGDTDEFQLVKLYASGSVAVSRTITKPVAGTIDIYVDAILQTGGISINTATGVVTFSTPPEEDAIITADFEFDVPVRFDTDELELSMDSFNAGSWNSIPLIEVRV